MAGWADGESSLDVDVLVGSDHYWDIVTGVVSKGVSGPTAIYTKSGWVLSGPTTNGSTSWHSANLVTTHVMKADVQFEVLNDRLKSFWELEALGIQEPEKAVYEEFTNTITFLGDRYEVSLPWKPSHNPLPDNYNLSLRRLTGLFRCERLQ